METGSEAKASETLLSEVKAEVKIVTMDTFAKECVKTERTQYKQWAACIIATLSMVAVGNVFGWTTTIITRLTSNETLIDVPVHITSDEASWVISITVIGSMIGPFYSAYFATFWGRKLCLLQTSIFYITGWLLILLAQNVWYLYVARLILGIGVGMSYTANPMYVSEVGDVNIRGALSTLIAVNVFTGSLLACSVGPWVSYHTLGVVLISIPIIFVMSFIWFPETPYYLVSKGRDEDAMRALAFFKDVTSPQELKAELDIVKRNLGSDSGDELKFSLRDLLLLTNVRNRRALLIVMGLILGQQFSGNFSTMQYMVQMFKDAKIGISEDVATIFVLFVGLIFGAMSTLTVENAGRRPLLIYSGFGSSVTLGVLGTYLYINHTGTDISSLNMLPVLAVIVFQVAYQIGLGTMPNLLIGELFSTNVKGIAGAIVTIFDGLLGFFVSKMYEVVSSQIGSHVPYFFFSFSCFVLFVFIYAYVPETKNRTFNEIQEILGELRPFKPAMSESRCWPFRRSAKHKTEEA